MHATSSARHTIRRAALAAVLAGAAVGVPAQGAHAQAILALEVGTGTLLAGGAGVSVPVTLTCTADAEYIAITGVQLTQRRGKTIVRGGSFNEPPATCDGTPHTYDLLVTAAAPFKPGDALADAIGRVCSEPVCGGVTEQVQQTIRIRH
jgi:hypothetical protein